MAFCYKCGSKIKEGALFCSECGASLSNGENIQSESAKEEVIKDEQSVVNIYRMNDEYKSHVRKTKKKVVIIGAIILAIIAVSFVVLKTVNRKDFVKNIRDWKPYELTYEMPNTLGEVIDSFFPLAEWENEKTDDGSYVTIHSILKDSDNKELDFVLKIKVTGNGSKAQYIPYSLSVKSIQNGSPETDYKDMSAELFLESMYVAFNMKTGTEMLPIIAHTLKVAEEGFIQYSNSEIGVEFEYPKMWELKYTGQVYIEDTPIPNDELPVLIQIGIDNDYKWVFVEGDSALKEYYQEYLQTYYSQDGAIIAVGSADLGGKEGKYIRYRLYSDVLAQEYFFKTNKGICYVYFAWNESLSELYAPAFKRIVESLVFEPASSSTNVVPSENGSYILTSGDQKMDFYVDDDYSDALIVEGDEVLDAYRIDHNASDGAYDFIPDMDDWVDSYFSSFYITANGGIEVIGFWIDDYGVVCADYYFWQDWNPYVAPRLYYSCSYVKIEE